MKFEEFYDKLTLEVEARIMREWMPRWLRVQATKTTWRGAKHVAALVQACEAGQLTSLTAFGEAMRSAVDPNGLQSTAASDRRASWRSYWLLVHNSTDSEPRPPRALIELHSYLP